MKLIIMNLGFQWLRNYSHSLARKWLKVFDGNISTALTLLYWLSRDSAIRFPTATASDNWVIHVSASICLHMIENLCMQIFNESMLILNNSDLNVVFTLLRKRKPMNCSRCVFEPNAVCLSSPTKKIIYHILFSSCSSFSHWETFEKYECGNDSNRIITEKNEPRETQKCLLISILGFYSVNFQSIITF